MKNLKFIVLLAFLISLGGCTSPFHEQPERGDDSQTTDEKTPSLPATPPTSNYRKTASSLPENLYFCGSSTIYPYLILDKSKLSKGVLENATDKVFDNYAYIFNFSALPLVVKGEGLPGVTTYTKATKEAFDSTEYEKSQDLLHQGYSYGFQDSSSAITLSLPIALDSFRGETLSEKWHNVFYAEYYFINFSVETGTTPQNLPSAKAFVSKIYWGSYARIVVTTNQKREKVFEAFNERLSNQQSAKWDQVLQDGELHISTSHIPLPEMPLNSDQFFAMIKGNRLNPKPIFFTVGK